MKSLYESILDIDDNIDNIDNVAEIHKWFKKLTTNNINDLNEAIPGFIESIKKNKAKRVASVKKMNYDTNYIVIKGLGQKKKPALSTITIYFLKSLDNLWSAWKISLNDLCYSHRTECRKVSYPIDERELIMSKRLHRIYIDEIYTFPKKWEYILNLIEHNDRS